MHAWTRARGHFISTRPTNDRGVYQTIIRWLLSYVDWTIKINRTVFDSKLAKNYEGLTLSYPLKWPCLVPSKES